MSVKKIVRGRPQRRINGESFEGLYEATSKSDARKTAENIRAQGYKARVIHQPSPYDAYDYVVYVNRITSVEAARRRARGKRKKR